MTREQFVARRQSADILQSFAQRSQGRQPRARRVDLFGGRIRFPFQDSCSVREQQLLVVGPRWRSRGPEATGTVAGASSASIPSPSFCTSNVEVAGDDQRPNASDRPSGETAGEVSPITPSGGAVRLRTFPSASRIRYKVDLPDSSDCEAKAIFAPSGVHASQLDAGNCTKRICRSVRSGPPVRA